MRAHRWIAIDVPIGVLSLLAISTATFMLEQLVLSGRSALMDYWHVAVWLGGSVIAWGGLLWFRSRLSASAGTLYYVRMLDPSMTDWHEAAERHAQKEYLQLFEVSRDTLMDEVDGVIDVRGQRRRAFEYLEELFNADDQSTGFSVAPNMLWPVALGLGYRAALRPGSTLVDFGEGDDTLVEWAPDAPAMGGRHVKSWKEPSAPGIGAAVLATLTTQPRASWPQWRTGSRVRVAGFAPDGEVQGVTIGKAGDHVRPGEAASAWVQAIREALHEAEGPVLLAAQVPKTVAFAAGYYLGRMPSTGSRASLPGCGDEDCRRPGCQNPWKLIVPLYWDPVARRYVPVWVVDGQSDPRTLLAELEPDE